MPNPIVCDTSVWLYSSYIGQTDHLSRLFEPVYTTEIVCQELDVGRHNRPGIIDPRMLPWVDVVQPSLQEIADLPANRLGAGELSVLAYAQAHNLPIVGFDDRQARELAQQLGLRVIGTIGILLKSKEAGLIDTVQPLMEQLIEEGFFINNSLFQYALQKAKEK